MGTRFRRAGCEGPLLITGRASLKFRSAESIYDRRIAAALCVQDEYFFCQSSYDICLCGRRCLILAWCHPSHNGRAVSIIVQEKPCLTPALVLVVHIHQSQYIVVV